MEIKNNKDCYIPALSASRFIYDVHCYLGHPGVFKLVNTLKKIYKIDSIYKTVKTVINKCTECQTNKSFVLNEGKISGSLLSNKALDFISSDILGPFQSHEFICDIEQSKFYLLMVTDIHSRYSKIGILNHYTAHEAWQCFS